VQTITLKINEKSSTGKIIKKMIMALMNTPDVEIIEGRYNKETEKVIMETKLGKGLTKLKNVNELKKILNRVC
jgi:hypothetical protein